MSERAPPQKRGGKITCDSQEACLFKFTRLVAALPQKHSAIAKGCEMWLTTALELWLTVHAANTSVGGERHVGAAAFMSSASTVQFCCFLMILAHHGCLPGQFPFYWARLRNVIFVRSKLRNDARKVRQRKTQEIIRDQFNGQAVRRLFLQPPVLRADPRKSAALCNNYLSSTLVTLLFSSVLVGAYCSLP